VESGAAQAFGFTPREIALVCASHMGMDLHVEGVRAMPDACSARAALPHQTRTTARASTPACWRRRGIAVSP
jgi:L-asparaginase II